MACKGLQCWKINDDFWRGLLARAPRPAGGRGGGMPHREAELVWSRWQCETLKSAGYEHDARGLDGRVADPADLMFRSSAKNVAGMTGIWKRAGGAMRASETRAPVAATARACSALRFKASCARQTLATARVFLGCVAPSGFDAVITHAESTGGRPKVGRLAKSSTRTSHMTVGKYMLE